MDRAEQAKRIYAFLRAQDPKLALPICHYANEILDANFNLEPKISLAPGEIEDLLDLCLQMVLLEIETTSKEYGRKDPQV